MGLPVGLAVTVPMAVLVGLVVTLPVGLGDGPPFPPVFMKSTTTMTATTMPMKAYKIFLFILYF